MATRTQLIAAVEATPGWTQCPQSKRGTYKKLCTVSKPGEPPRQRIYRIRCNPLAMRIEGQMTLHDGSKRWVNRASAYYGDIPHMNGQYILGGFRFGKAFDIVADVL